MFRCLKKSFPSRATKLLTCVAVDGVLLEDLAHAFRATTKNKVERKSLYKSILIQAWRLLRHVFRRKERLWLDARFWAKSGSHTPSAASLESSAFSRTVSAQ